MITNKELTDWLFYESRYKDALDKNEYSDPKYLDLNFPHRENFRNKLLTCTLKDFVSTLVWIFKDKYPWEYPHIETGQMQWDNKNRTLISNTNIREAQDIYPLEFVEDEQVIGYLLSLKIRFKNPQFEAINWVEKALEGKNYIKKTNDDDGIYIYIVEDSIIDYIETHNDYVLITIDKEKHFS
ncbi:hypothetical protein DS884_06835 [Tenacibaculum sp. E3R01]|uniref:hypothetical protein n=1 Tax=Tenacibaculum sp. E3R01 TaxID=2267227 RepID=UPI000DE8F9D8|nr:hypothetical protein [Tenacibaculum sp. E3R01]RBW59449.1 hypothetical protein DS884_06835 [Tenacibaculum sp. E3R01]